MEALTRKGRTFAGAWLLILAIAACGKIVPLLPEGELGDAVIGDGQGLRTDGSDQGSIISVTQIYEAVGDGTLPGFSVGAGDYPFTNNPVAIGAPSNNQHTPFYFTYTYPPNNYSLAEAHLLIDTERDATDTEGIWVDGVFTGRPPGGNVNGASPNIVHAHYAGSGNPENTYYMDFSLAHYAQFTRNTFDLDIAELLTPSPLTVVDVISDGQLLVETGDDSPVYQAFLIVEGYTISKDALTCTNTSPVSFQNIYLHNDGNSIGENAFTGTVETPFESVSSGVAGFKSIEMFFDAILPRVPVANIDLSGAVVDLTIARNTAATAIVVNGVGVAEGGFNQAMATSAVEQWEDSASATGYLASFLGTIPTDGTPTAASLDLVQLLGETQLLALIAQGKLNLSFAGGFRRVTAGNATSNRALGNPVSGPELDIDGSHFSEVCTVPDNPDSPLQDGEPPPPSAGDETSPAVTSLQATEITSSSAAIQWLTDEGATTQVGSGVGNTDTLSTEDATLKTFHRVELTGLQAYKYYYYRAITRDGLGNETVSATKVFRTLR